MGDRSRWECWWLEHRRSDERPYDECSPATIWHPNGSLMCSFDRPLVVALARQVLAMETLTRSLAP